MRLTTKGRYAVTAMLDLAIHREQGPISLADISQRQGISLSYLEQLFGRLRKGMLVKSVRGPGGGYELTERPSTSKFLTSSTPSMSRSTRPNARVPVIVRAGETCLTITCGRI